MSRLDRMKYEFEKKQQKRQREVWIAEIKKDIKEQSKR